MPPIDNSLAANCKLKLRCWRVGQTLGATPALRHSMGGRLREMGLWREGILPSLARISAPALRKKRLSALGKAGCLPSEGPTLSRTSAAENEVGASGYGQRRALGARASCPRYAPRGALVRRRLRPCAPIGASEGKMPSPPGAALRLLQGRISVYAPPPRVVQNERLSAEGNSLLLPVTLPTPYTHGRREELCSDANNGRARA